jgi:hypothetical protein
MKRKQQEQCMTRNRVFTTGAFVVPVRVKINGIEAWRWIIDSFEDDSFFDGKVFNPSEYASNFDKLFVSSYDC